MIHGRMLWLLPCIFLFAACQSTPELGRLGPDELFQRGVADLERGRPDQAIQAFQRLTLEYPTHPSVPEARFRLGDAYMARGEQVTAAAEFARFVTDYPAHELADDARLRSCRAYEELSPRVQLDQEYTSAALEHCEALVLYHPESELVPEAREIAERMRHKLAQKILIGGEFYFRNRAYDSAIVYYDEVVRLYPLSPSAPRALFRLVQIYERLGYQQELEQTRQRLFLEYPGTSEAAELRERGDLAL